MKYSLFIGRWQPFHEGHRRLIMKSKNPLIAIRDTKIDSKNPYTYQQRKRMIRRVFPNIKIIKIPDISEVCFGRNVGYKIREIKLDKKTEAISATKIRKNDYLGYGKFKIRQNNSS